MRVIITKTAGSATQYAASMIASCIATRQNPVLGLATGRTMEGVYRNLTALHIRNGLDFSRVSTFNLDEYVGLSEDDTRSYHHYMRDFLFDHVNVSRSATHLPNGMAMDLVAECAAYEAAIQDKNGIDLQLLGIGDTGHIGFNEPPSSFDTRTRCVHLDRKTREQNAGMFNGNPEAVPDRALTMGVGTILEARSLVLLALGPAKAEIVHKALEGTISPEVSASAIRLHKDCTVILDTNSASALSDRILDTADYPAL